MRIAFNCSEGKSTMLKISVIDSNTQRRLVLEGKLVAPWVAELRAAWKAANLDLQGRELVIEMADITSISQESENTLLQLMDEGAKIRCRGVFIKHIVQQLTRRTRKNAVHPGKGEQNQTT
jgi:hypothetical protein